MAGVEPKSLYKYLGFSDRMVEQLYHGKVYYADPGTFNDPLDCRPVVVAGNQTIEGLQSLLKLMIVRRVEKEATVSFKRLRLRGEKLDVHRAKLGLTQVNEVIRGIEYSCTHPDIEDHEAYFKQTLLKLIQDEVRKTHATGVLCLSEKFDSPLMWSHYGAQHRGVCIEYDVSKMKASSIRKVAYGGERQISADCLLRWVEGGDEAAQQEVERASLLTKSAEWKYEKEWRFLGAIGLNRSPAPIKSVTFGMNCSAGIRESVMSMFGGEGAIVKFWRVLEPSSSFKLKRERLHFDDSMRPVSHDLSGMLDDFDDLIEATQA